MTSIILGCLLLAVPCHVWAENVHLSPTGALRTVYETEWRRVRTSIGRFASVHHKCQDLLMKSGIEVDGLSFIWYAPYFGYSDFASVFWKTNRIVVVTARKKVFNVRMYPVSQEMSAVRTQLEKRLEDYQFVCPLGGNGNVSEIGVLVKGSTMKLFSLQTDYCFRMNNKRKVFCGTRESVIAYEYMIKVDDYLRDLKQKRCIMETYIVLDGE